MAMEHPRWFLEDGNVVLRLRQSIVPDEGVQDMDHVEFKPGSMVLFCVHRSIFSMASQVFKDLFRQSRQGQDGEVYHGLPLIDCPDQDPTGFAMVCSFIYPVASRPVLTVPICSILLYAADRYEMPSLKAVAAQALQSPSGSSNEPLLHSDAFKAAALGRQFGLEEVWTTASSVILQQSFRRISMEQVDCLSSPTLLELIWMRERQQERWLKLYSNPPPFEHACGSERASCIAIYDKEWHGAFWRHRTQEMGDRKGRPASEATGPAGTTVFTNASASGSASASTVSVSDNGTPCYPAMSAELLSSTKGVLLPNKRFWAEVMLALESFPLKSVACRIKASQAVAAIQEEWARP